MKKNIEIVFETLKLENFFEDRVWSKLGPKLGPNIKS